MFTLPSNRRDLLQMVLALDVTLQQQDLTPEHRARLRPGLSPRMCSGAQSSPVGWWPCCAPSAPNGPPGSAPPAGGPFGRSRPVPHALRYHLRRAGGRGHRRRRGKLPPVGPAGPAI